MRQCVKQFFLFTLIYISQIAMPSLAMAQQYTSDLSCIDLYDIGPGGEQSYSHSEAIPGTELIDTGYYESGGGYTIGPDGHLIANEGVWHYDGVCSNVIAYDEDGNPDYTQLTTKVVDVVFSWILCNFILTINEVMGTLYCGLKYKMIEILGTLFTFYIAIYGAQLLMGTVRFTAKEFILRLGKIAMIWIFVTQAAFGVSMVFNFFFSLTGEASAWSINAVLQSSSFEPDPSNPLAFLAEKYQDGGLDSSAGFLDDIIYASVVGPFTLASSKLLGFFAALSIIFPPVFFLAVLWLWQNFLIAARAMVTFMLGMSAIGFLVAIGPIFLSFMLFQVTYQLFENWLRYLVSFSLQIILIFAVVAIWLAANSYFIHFFNDLSDVVFPYQKVEARGAKSNINDSYGLCPHDISINNGVIANTRIKCNRTGYGMQEVEDGIFIPREDLTEDERHDLIGMSKIPEMQNFLYYLIYNLISLIILAYGFSGLVKAAPHIAQELAGPDYIPLLGQGFGYSNSHLKGMARIDKNVADRPLFSFSNFKNTAKNFGRGDIFDPSSASSGSESK